MWATHFSTTPAILHRKPRQARTLLRRLAESGVYFGTSSWKYEGWLGSIYTPKRYVTRKKFSRKKFEAECIREYAATFPTVGGDFSFYQFPSAETGRGSSTAPRRTSPSDSRFRKR